MAHEAAEPSATFRRFGFATIGVHGVVEKLPDAEVPFGLTFHCGFYAGVPLKELAGLKNLHSLCIGAFTR